MTFSIVNEKGGSGKSTLAVNLASCFAKIQKTLLLDTDPQRSTNVFSNIRAENELPILFSNVSKFGSSLKEELLEMKKIFQTIIIDTSGRDTKDSRLAMLSSDVIIIPVLPSQFDVDVLEHMLNVFDEVKVLNSKLLGFILPNRVSPNPFLSKDIESLNSYIQELVKEKQLKDIYLLKNCIHERQTYRKSIIDGKSLNEFCDKKDKALIEFEMFFDEMNSMIKERIWILKE